MIQKFFKLSLLALVAFLFSTPYTVKAQSSNMGIFFQAIARDNMSNPAKDRKIYVQTSLLNNSTSSTSLLTETHISKTDAAGIFSISIGQGNKTGGTLSGLSAIPWANAPIYLNVKIAITPTSPDINWDYNKEWIDLGTNPFGTVPYALYAGGTALNDNKLNIADTALMLAPYAKAVSNLIKSTATPVVNVDSVNIKLNNKLAIKDSNLLYITPYALSLKNFDTSFIYQKINTKLNNTDTLLMLAPYAKTASLPNLLAPKMNLLDTANMLIHYALNSNLKTVAFSGNYNDLSNKPAALTNIVNSVNGLNGDVIVDKATLNIFYVDNTTDLNKPVSTLTGIALNTKVDKTAINAANGVAGLDANTKIPTSLLPAISFTSVSIAHNQTEMQSIGTNSLKGTVAVRTDISKTFVLAVDHSGLVSDWIEMLTPGAPVQSVNGQLGNVNLTTSDITEGSNEYYTNTKARAAISSNLPINYNIATGLITADTSNSNAGLATKYALQHQNSLLTASINNKLNLSDTATMLSAYKNYAISLNNNKLNASDTNYLSNRINLKEAGANKSTDINLDGSSLIKFPTTNAVKRYVDSVADVLNTNIVASNNGIVLPDATTTAKGILKLAGDLSGTASLPTIANGAINTTKIIDGAITSAKVLDAAITDSKIASGISASKVGLGNVNNTTDLEKPISTLTQNALNLKLNKTDTSAMLSAYLTNIHTTNNALSNKLNTSDTSAMLAAYKNYQITLNNNKLNISDTSTMLSPYLTALHTKEQISNKSNDATLGGGSPSATLYPTQAAVKQYITNNAGSGSISATSIVGVVAIANGGTGQSTANAALNALIPAQTSNSGKFLTTDGTNTSWGSSSGGWSLTGNTGMVDGTNFIGTTDAQPLNFRTNNIKSGRIDVSAIIGQTSFGYGAGANALNNSTSPFAGTRNTGIGYQAMYNTTYGKENVVLGYQALYNNFSASGSTAIGYQAMLNAYNISTSSSYNTYNTAVGYQALLGSTTLANNNGISNTAVGHQAIRSNSSGANNTALGYISLYANTTGNNNTSIGYNALSSMNTGSSNTAIGSNADVRSNVSNATAIGYGAWTNVDNTIQLGNESLASVTTQGILNSTNTTESTNAYTGALTISGGAGITKNLSVGGKLIVNEADIKVLKGNSITPIMTLGAGAGNMTSNLTNTGSDLAGNVSFKSLAGSSNSNNSVILTITFSGWFTSAPYVVLTPTNITTASIPASQAVYVVSNTSGFSIYSNNTALTASNYNYAWNYMVIQ